MSFTWKIMIGLLLGVACGLFFGEIMAPFDPLGQAYIGLLQMTVLPYIILSLISNLGRISWAQSRGLLLTTISVFGVMLLTGAFVLMLTPLAFPPIESASFFSRALVDEPATIDLVGMYVPSNIFGSLASNAVPAAVLFSILLGIGISTVPGNETVLKSLDVLADGLNKVNKLVIKITPLGVFAIAAATAGTVSFEDISRLQGFIITYTLLVGVMVFLVLPLFLRALTPFTWREVLGVPKDSLITIFATGKIIVLMPQLIENVKEIFRRHELLDDNTERRADIIMPLAYPFPNLGTYTILLFVPFAAWYLGRPLDFGDQITLQGASLLSAFVAPIVGIPFLLDIMRMPSDVMDLFVVSTVYTDRVRVVLGAMHLMTLTIIVLAIRRGVFKPNWKRLSVAVVVSIVAILLAILGSRAYLVRATAGDYHGYEDLMRIAWMERAVAAVEYRDELPPVAPPAFGTSRLKQIPDRGTLRVGYLPDSLPWAFVNDNGVVTGFDIEMGHALARDLGVSLELVRTNLDDIDRLFENGQIDLVMSGLAATPDRLRRYRFAGTPVDLTLGVLVPDHRRKEFEEFQSIREMDDLVIGVVQDDPAFQRSLSISMPKAEIRYVGSPRAFLKGEGGDIDVVLYSAEGGSAWTLLYPEFSIVVPKPVQSRIPAGYIVARGDDEWAKYIEQWTRIKRHDGQADLLFRHWIQGEGSKSTEPRWSVIRDVLGWID